MVGVNELKWLTRKWNAGPTSMLKRIRKVKIVITSVRWVPCAENWTFDDLVRSVSTCQSRVVEKPETGKETIRHGHLLLGA